MKLEEITVTVLTRNSARHIQKVLEALVSFGEVLIFDSGSEDATLSIAKTFSNVTIAETTFDGFGVVHNRAVDLAKNNWVLSIDSDEVATSELILEIERLQADERTVYAFPRKNYYRGKWIRHCGWYPDYVLRLFHRKQTRFSDAQVHESVITEGLEVVHLGGALIHYSYENTADFLGKMQSYSTLWAEQNRGRKSSLGKAIFRAGWSFFRCYILQRGFLDGREGFVISLYNANVTFYKYLKLAGY
jgi:glycosyltransferase involved in cell wall biosynthesis